MCVNVTTKSVKPRGKSLETWSNTMISGVVLARNEQSSIVDCLRSMRPWVAELLLIDMESTDRTVEVVRAVVDRVLQHKWIQNFDAARNLAIPEALYDWLWFVDADERVPAATGKVVNELIATRGHEFEAISIPFKSHFCGKWILPSQTNRCTWPAGHDGFPRRVAHCAPCKRTYSPRATLVITWATMPRCEGVNGLSRLGTSHPGEMR